MSSQNEDTMDRTLEINPKHSLIRSLATSRAERSGKRSPGCCTYLLLDQARLIEGDLPTDPISFSERMTRMMEKRIA